MSRRTTPPLFMRTSTWKRVSAESANRMMPPGQYVEELLEEIWRANDKAAADFEREGPTTKDPGPLGYSIRGRR